MGLPTPGGLFRAALVAATVLATSAPRLASAQPDPAALCDIRTTERVVAIGDVHGAYDRFVAILRAAALVDGRTRWIGGRAILVQTGDVLDRGPHSRRVLDLIRRLEREASQHGGAVHALLGNHEAMRIFLQWNDVSAGEYAAFRTIGSDEARERLYSVVAADAARRARDEKRPFDERAFRTRFLREVPPGYIEMRQAFGPEGDYGSWLRDRPAMVRINGVLFVHGGVDEATASLGCGEINATVRREIRAHEPTPDAMQTMMAAKPAGPLWYRGLADHTAPASPEAVEAALRVLGARAIVVGHTPVPGFRIVSRLGGRVITIDTGMLGGSSYPGGVASALEIRGDALTAIYESDREALPPLPAAVP
jgi:hypothetical protein